MRYLAVITLLLVPSLASASCSQQGATVIYVNGIFTNLNEAQDDLDKLIREYYKKYGDQSIKFLNGYNPSHLGGFGDLIKSIQQAYKGEGVFIEDTDLKTILLQIHPKVTTQKIILVGHSQGTYYTNAMYEYLTKHGVSENSIEVYNVATPAGFVAGGGQYLTSATDNVINKIRSIIKSAPSVESFGAGAVLSTVQQTRPKDPLQPNITFALTRAEEDDEKGGHSFSGVYLKNAPNIIVSAIRNDISRLSASADLAGDCFVSPSEDVAYKVSKKNLAVLDFAVDKTKPALAFLRDFAVDVGQKVPTNAAAAANSFVKAIIPKPREENLPHSFDIVSSIYGSSVTESDLEDLLGTKQGGAVALAVQEPKTQKVETKVAAQEGEVKGAETEKKEPEPPAVEPLIPPPTAAGGGGGISPGFGAGAPSGEEPSPVDTSPPADTTPPAAPLPAPAVVSVSDTVSVDETPPVEEWFTAASLSPHRFVVTFDQDIMNTPTIGVTSNPLDLVGDLQTVTDCGDVDLQTFCFDYSIPSEVEAGTLHNVHIADAEGSSATMTPDHNHRFVVDTLGPTVLISTFTTNSLLPTIHGTSLTDPDTVQIFFNGIFYQVAATPQLGDWSITLEPGGELAEGVYTLIASSTDRVGNRGAQMQADLTADFTPPVITVNFPAEGDAVASTTVFTIGYSVSDALPVSVVCTVSPWGEAPCEAFTNIILAPGEYSVPVIATDAAGNSSTVVRNFTVLP